MSYNYRKYRAECIEWERKYGDIKYLHPATFPKWIKPIKAIKPIKPK